MGHAGAAGGSNDDGKEEEEEQEVRLLSVSWNQDSSCFAAATTADFRVFACRGGGGFRETMRRVRAGGGGFAIAEMLFCSNIFAVVAADLPAKLELWDDHANRVREEHRLPSDVLAVRMSRAHLAVVLDRLVRVFDLQNPARPPRKVETAPNRRGLCCLSCHADAPSVMACPGTTAGQVRVEDLGKKTTKLIAAHRSEVACMAMAVDGTVLATASVKGTLIRVFSTTDGTCLHEVRRGSDNAIIHSIALSRNLQWLAVSSDRRTLHVFSLRYTVSNAVSSLSLIKGLLPNYFSSEWSFAQFHLPEATRYIAAFGEENTVMLIGMDGRCSFDPVNGGQMVRKEYFRFLKDTDTPAIRTLTT
ncbi:hypothetical protein ACP70R_041351 [Stipagrostis hirtigluma subsp. patula]